MFLNRFLLMSTVIGCSLASVAAGEESRQAVCEAAIRKAVAAYVAAFNEGDAKALAALWAPDAVYTNPLSGEEVIGRDAIEQLFTAIFAEAKGAKVEATTVSIGFVSPNVAVEHGLAKVIYPDQTFEESQYSAVYINHQGQWLLDRVTEEVIPELISHYEHLKELEWMVGSWVDQDDEATVVTECQWARNNNFLIRWFAVQVGEEIDMAGVQIIGWDPAEKRIRSWVFDSDGGFGQATWFKHGNRWDIHQSGVLPDGRKASAVNIITYVDDNTCTLQSVNRTVDGELLPNVEEVQITKNQ